MIDLKDKASKSRVFETGIEGQKFENQRMAMLGRESMAVNLRSVITSRVLWTFFYEGKLPNESDNIVNTSKLSVNV